MLKFNSVPPYNEITLEVYEDTDCRGVPLADCTLWLCSKSLNCISIDLSKTDYKKPIHPVSLENTTYQNIIKGYKGEWDLYKHPLAIMPGGDRDTDFHAEGDFDRDTLSNIDEVLFYSSYPHYPTISLSLQKGINLFYFPSIVEMPNITQRGQDSPVIYCYDHALRTWEKAKHHLMKSNTFYAIYSDGPGMLYCDLTECNSPIIGLKGFADTLSPADLPINIFNPDHFKANSTTGDIFNIPDLKDIKAIHTNDFKNGSWKSSYTFFGKVVRKDILFMPYDVYFVIK